MNRMIKNLLIVSVSLIFLKMSFAQDNYIKEIILYDQLFDLHYIRVTSDIDGIFLKVIFYDYEGDPLMDYTKAAISSELDKSNLKIEIYVNHDSTKKYYAEAIILKKSSPYVLGVSAEPYSFIDSLKFYIKIENIQPGSELTFRIVKSNPTEIIDTEMDSTKNVEILNTTQLKEDSIKLFPPTRPTIPSKVETEDNLKDVDIDSTKIVFLDLPSPPLKPKTLNQMNEKSKIIRKLENASISFNAPETMKVAETKTIMLLMSKKEDIPQLSNAIKEQISEPGKIHSDTVKISSIMEASLTGQGFLIDAITPVRQFVHSYETNMWKWEVTAKETGNKKLHLTINALIADGKDEELHTIKTYERTVLVYVRFGDKILAFLGGNWQFLFGAVASPLVIYFWRRITSRKKST